jgi:hypothetical protein
LDIVIAQSDISDSARLDFRLIPQSTTHLGTSMVAAMYAPPGGAGTTQSVPTQVTITAFPPTLVMDQDGGRDPVTGSLSIDTIGFSISGSFSSSLCAVIACG